MTSGLPDVIGFAGRARSGKDTAAAALVRLGWRRVAFADRLRDAVAAIDPLVGDGLRLSALFAAGETWESVKAGPYAGEVRRLLQRTGTEMGRDLFGPRFWVDQLDRTVRPGERVVVSDVRFTEEADWVRSRGGMTVLVSRPGQPAVGGHRSEYCALAADVSVTNDRTVADLHAAVLAALARPHTVGA